MTTAAIEIPPRAGKGNRTAFTVVCHNKDGEERKRVLIKDRTVMKCVLFVMAAFLVATIGGDELDRWSKRHKADALRPKMEALANQGQDAASVWMLKHYFAENKQRLAPLANKGNPDAMFQQGIYQIWGGDKDGGMRWVERAAAVGNADAIQYIENKKQR